MEVKAKSGLTMASSGPLVRKIPEPSRPQLQDPGVSQHPEGVCWPREGKTQPQFTLEPLLAPLSKTTTGDFLTSLQAPVLGVPACVPACLPACPRAPGERRGDWGPASTQLRNPHQVLCETGSQPRVFLFELGNGSGVLE